jgi:hypothetical protein
MPLRKDISKSNIELRLSRDNSTMNRKEKYENNASISTKKNMNRQVITSLRKVSLALKAQRPDRSPNATQQVVFRFFPTNNEQFLNYKLLIFKTQVK